MKTAYIVIFVLLIIFIIYLFHAYEIRRITPKGEVIRPEETFAVMVGNNYNTSKVFYINGKEAPILHLKKDNYYEFFGEKDLYFSEKQDDPNTKIKHIPHPTIHSVFFFTDRKGIFYYNHKFKKNMGGKIIIK